MKVGSLFAGIGGMDLGFEQAGHSIEWCCEIDEKCQSILRKHFPNTKIFGDVKQCSSENLEKVDIITAGFPCQDCSIASGAKREGLQGKRSGLFYEAVRLIRELRPRFAIFENVPGLLTSADGLDFASVLSELDGCGSRETAWRILDSRYFGVAQRRKRVFIVADFGGECASQILFEQEGLRRYIEEGKGKECSVTTKTQENVRNPSCCDGGQISDTLDVSMTEKRRFNAVMFEPGNLTRNVGNKPSETIVGTLGAGKTGDLFPHVAITHSGGIDLKFSPVSNTISTQVGSETTAMFNGVWQMNHAAEVYRQCEEGVSPTLQERMGTGGNNVPLVGIRRFIPLECERLQSFPDYWTADGINEDGKIIQMSDANRYKMLGNAITVNVAKWIGIGLKGFENDNSCK